MSSGSLIAQQKQPFKPPIVYDRPMAPTMAETSQIADSPTSISQPSEDTRIGSPPNLSPLRDSIESATKAGVLVIGTAYIFGLLIINMHLRRYGINYLGFLQIEYVMSGLLWGFLVAFTYSLWAFLKFVIRSRTKYVDRKKPIHSVGGVLLVLVGVLGSYNLYAVTLNFLAEGQIGFGWRVPFWLMLNVMILFVAIDRAKGFRKDFRAEKAFDLLYYVGSVVIALSMYTYGVFPKLSQAFGGGSPKAAIFIIKPDQTETISAIGIQSLLENRKVGPVEVIFEASDFFLVNPPRDFANSKVRAIRVNKDLIQATLYINDKPTSPLPFIK